MTPQDEGMGDKKVTVKITNGVAGHIENGGFNTTLSPSFTSGAGNPWTWFSGAARVTLPSSITQTQVLNIPFNGIAGNTYDFTVNVDILVGSGSSGATSRIAISFNDGVTFTD